MWVQWQHSFLLYYLTFLFFRQFKIVSAWSRGNHSFYSSVEAPGAIGKTAVQMAESTGEPTDESNPQSPIRYEFLGTTTEEDEDRRIKIAPWPGSGIMPPPGQKPKPQLYLDPFDGSLTENPKGKRVLDFSGDPLAKRARMIDWIGDVGEIHFPDDEIVFFCEGILSANQTGASCNAQYSSCGWICFLIALCCWALNSTALYSRTTTLPQQ